MKNLQYIFMILFSSTALFANISHTVSDAFFEDDYKKIIRYDMLHFTQEGVLDENSKQTFAKALKKIKELQKSSETFKVTLVGHMYNANDYYPKAIDTDLSYKIDINTTNDKSVQYVNDIKTKLLDNAVERENIYLYAKRGKLLAYSDETQESADLSNRVMLSIYILEPKDIDSDKDGVFDRFDRCVATPRGSKVDKNGCPVDSDNDGVLDYKDKCPGTPPENVNVDAYGCPLDSDHDGVVDYKDKCENTPDGIIVDPHGCAIKQTLQLNFKTASDKILKSSYPSVVQFAEFLKNNPGYKVKITGHTDSVGKAVTNMALSIKRAKAVKAALVAQGIDASRITTAGRGELDPIASNRTKEGRKANRRIEIQLFN